MASVKLNAPKGATEVVYRRIQYVIEPDGTLTVPSFAVPELVAAGCEWPDGDHTQINHTEEIKNAESHELSQYLNARGLADHYWEKNLHVFSDQLRAEVGDQKLFVHHGPTKTTLTVEKGSIAFSSTSHEALMFAWVESKLVPEGTRMARVTHSSISDEAAEGKDRITKAMQAAHVAGNIDEVRKLAGELRDQPHGIRGELKLPEGKTPDDITSGTDPEAQFMVYVDGHTLADHLDDYHGQFHKGGRGRIAVLTHEQKLKKVLELHEKETLREKESKF